MFEQLQPILPCTADAPDGVLRIGGVAATELAEAYGTPVIAYDRQHLERSARAWTDAFAAHTPGALVAYASKAFSSVGMLALLGELGLGADVASEGELRVAIRAGIDPARIVVHGNNKSEAELAAAVDAGVGLIVLDAPDELELLAAIAIDRGRTQDVLVRLNPDIEVETHRYISTSHAGSKFGVPGDVASSMLVRATEVDGLRPLGVHLHLGSQLLDLDPWRRVLTWLAGWALELRERTGVTIEVLDVGGGLGIAYTEAQDPPTPAQVAECVLGTLETTWSSVGLQLPRLVVEPGRSIVGQAAVTIYRVGVVKATGDDDVHYVNVDGGMSDNPRPVLYQATYRALLAERVHDAAAGAWWVAGVHCESGDVLVEDAQLPHPRRGELLAIPATGAYAASMASTYNLVPRCAVVLVGGGEHRVLLRRETLDELLARDADADRVGA
ncbi:MAG: diaminopimelate decarboxylase [Thermoleophilia bacterium]|nr:diaminopimelate decarboxylase [Thermoleophilia bacterium]